MFLYKRKDSPNWYIGFTDEKKRGQVLHKFLSYPVPIREKAKAYRLFSEWEKRQELQYLGLPVEATPIPVKRFYLDYQRWCDTNKAKTTVRIDSYRLNVWLQFLEKQKVQSVGQISKKVLNRFLEDCISRSSNATLNRYLSLIQASLRWGVRQGHLRENSLQGFGRLKETREPRLAEISDEDLKKLFSIKDEKFKLFLSFVYWTLARKGEILALTWGDVDLKRKVVTYRVTKTRVLRRIPMADRLFEVVTMVNGSPGKKDEKIFPWSVDYVSRKFQRLRERLDVKIEGIHRFRHARASELLRRGANPRGVQELLGHKSSRTTMEIYAQINLDGLREIVTKL